jgi:hypothetical protein
MAKIRITTQDGKPTPYFYWSNESRSDPTRLPVYKSASHGVKRIRGVFFNAVTNRIAKV